MSHEEATSASKISALEERAILAALGARPDPSVASEGDVDPELLREYREVLAQLPLALDLEAPPPQLRARLLAALDTQAPQDDPAEPSPVPAPLAFHRPAKSTASRGSFGWPQALAAVLALAVAGLGWFALQLNGQLADQQVTLTQLQQELDEQRQAGSQLRHAQHQKYVMTQTAARLYQLQAPNSPNPEHAAPGAHGALYICGQTHKWYVGLTGLQPTSKGGHYQIWFVTEHGEMPGARFQVSNPGFVEVDGDQLPDGVEIPDVLGVLVTFLPDDLSDETARSPESAGQAVLHSQRSFEL